MSENATKHTYSIRNKKRSLGENQLTDNVSSEIETVEIPSSTNSEEANNEFSKTLSGRGSLVVKVTDSWLAYHEFEPCTAENPLCRRRCTLNMSMLKHAFVGAVWKLGEGVPAQVSSSSLDHGSKLGGPSPKALE
ncbi:hypothetical protein TNCV_413161 [Trichonephila clavipes]|nr:hypothetical protein TNCV_413161 [Trichonephila clavipes]